MQELNSLLDLLGEELTLKLVENFGGIRITVPASIMKTHAIADVLGESGLALMVQYFGGRSISVPQARAWRIQHYLDRGLLIREIARKVNCSEAAVYNYKRAQKESAQMSMDI